MDNRTGFFKLSTVLMGNIRKHIKDNEESSENTECRNSYNIIHPMLEQTQFHKVHFFLFSWKDGRMKEGQRDVVIQCKDRRESGVKDQTLWLMLDFEVWPGLELLMRGKNQIRSSLTRSNPDQTFHLWIPHRYK